ncbi:MAG: ATP-binding cassette domain-containing protein [Coriobacteriia bacterium]|nr:ATP-binding cassette domain-containing protein [Coriobacteriia bacterium]
MIIASLTKRYRKTLALSEVSFKLSSGCVALLGPNGAGKTTLINCIAGLEQPTSGAIKLPQKNLNLGYLPQQFNLMPHLSIFEALSYLAVLGNLDAMSLAKEIDRVIELANLSDYRDLRVGELSGGVLRRLGIAQALLGSPEMLLLDEPSVGLDIQERGNLKSVLARATGSNAMIISTHIVDDIKGLCDRILVLNRGRLCFDGDPVTLTAFAKGRVCISSDRSPRTRGGIVSTSFFVEDIQVSRYVMPDKDLAYTTEPTLEEGYLALLHNFGD